MFVFDRSVNGFFEKQVNDELMILDDLAEPAIYLFNVETNTKHKIGESYHCGSIICGDYIVVLDEMNLYLHNIPDNKTLKITKTDENKRIFINCHLIDAKIDGYELSCVIVKCENGINLIDNVRGIYRITYDIATRQIISIGDLKGDAGVISAISAYFSNLDDKLGKKQIEGTLIAKFGPYMFDDQTCNLQLFEKDGRKFYATDHEFETMHTNKYVVTRNSYETLIFRRIFNPSPRGLHLNYTTKPDRRLIIAELVIWRLPLPTEIRRIIQQLVFAAEVDKVVEPLVFHLEIGN